MSEVRLIHGDCLEVLPTLEAGSVDAVITDPPWGSNNDCDYTRFSGGLWPNHHHRRRGIIGDDEPFDPSPWLGFPQVVLWGYQFFAPRLPVGTLLVWNKKRDSQLGTFLSDGEIAWQKGGKGVYIFPHVWHGFDRASERNQGILHPTQKPVALFRWCLERATKPGDTVIDPYMGSGSCGVACIETGRDFIGIELDADYFTIAQRRIEAAQNEMVQLSLDTQAEIGYNEVTT